MQTYTAEAHRDGKFWSIYIPEIDRHTQARRYAEIEPMARDLITTLTGANVTSVSVSVRNIEIDDALRQWREAEQLDRDGREAMAQAASHKRAIVTRLRDEGFTGTDTATALGITKARISQLLHSN